MNPPTCTDSSPLFMNNKRHPIIAINVASPHTAVGRVFHTSHSNTPENTGALPIVATVPMATPVRRMDEKKSPWKGQY